MADDRGPKKTPEILSQLRQLLREETAGDPMARRGLWTGLRLEQIRSQLGCLGLSVCPNTVRRLLEEMDYALRANRKSLSGQQSPERDRRFRYLQVQRQEFTRQGLPIICVDTQKKEMVGPDGTGYQPRLHDLRHAMATHCLVSWYRQGRETRAILSLD